MFPLFWGIDDPTEQQKYLRQVIAAVQAQREAVLGKDGQRPFDIVTTGETPARQPDQAEEHIAGYAAAGATWWLESLNPERSNGATWSFAQLRDRVLAGPRGKN